MALAPLYLVSLYPDLTNARIISFAQSVDITSSFMLMRPFFVCFCGRVGPLSPNQIEFKAVKPNKVIVDGEESE